MSTPFAWWRDGRKVRKHTPCEVGRSTGLLCDVPLAMEGHLYEGNSDLA